MPGLQSCSHRGSNILRYRLFYQCTSTRSDNGTNFTGADQELKLKRSIQEWNNSKIENTLLQHGITWMFNPPAGSHHGGVWERIIRSIKKVLNATLKVQNLDEEGLQTFLYEVEAILNCRPITTPSNDPNDLKALTPNTVAEGKTCFAHQTLPRGRPICTKKMETGAIHCRPLLEEMD